MLKIITGGFRASNILGIKSEILLYINNCQCLWKKKVETSKASHPFEITISPTDPPISPLLTERKSKMRRETSLMKVTSMLLNFEVSPNKWAYGATNCDLSIDNFFKSLGSRREFLYCFNLIKPSPLVTQRREL